MPTNNERVEVLVELLDYSSLLAEISARLAAFPWDSEQELVVLRGAHIASILGRFVNGELSASDVAGWADKVEVRDDIGFESRELTDVVFRLSSPEINGALTTESAISLIASLT